MTGSEATEPGSTGRRASAEHSSDPELVAAANNGDRSALEALLRRHHDRIHLLCHRLCRDRGDADDATQNALMSIVRGLPRYDGRSEFTTWSYRVATNACFDELRRRSRRPVPTEHDHDAVERSGRLDDPADLVVGTETRTRLQAALDELPEDFRVVVVLRDVADLDYAEIGSMLDLPPGTVRSRIARGRAKLASILSADPDRSESGNHTAPADVGRDETP